MPSLEVGGVATESSRGSPGIMKGSTFDTLCGYATQKKLSIFFRLAALVLRIEGSGGKLEKHKCFEMFGVDGRRVILKVTLSLVEGSHLLTPSVSLFDIGVVCFYNMTGIRSDEHYNSDERVPGYSFGR